MAANVDTINFVYCGYGVEMGDGSSDILTFNNLIFL